MTLSEDVFVVIYSYISKFTSSESVKIKILHCFIHCCSQLSFKKMNWTVELLVRNSICSWMFFNKRISENLNTIFLKTQKFMGFFPAVTAVVSHHAVRFVLFVPGPLKAGWKMEQIPIDSNVGDFTFSTPIVISLFSIHDS